LKQQRKEIADWITQTTPPAVGSALRSIIQRIISKHCAAPVAAESSEVKRLRKALRSYRETAKAWQSHVLVTSRLLGCTAIDKDVEAAIDKLKHNFAEARARTIAASELATALESLAKGEGENG
jgi:hypothetical protein